MRKSKFIVSLEHLSREYSLEWFTTQEVMVKLDSLEREGILQNEGGFNLVHYVSSELGNLTQRKNPQVESSWLGRKRIWRLIPKP